MKPFFSLCRGLMAAVLLLPAYVQAGDLIMVRSPEPFAETMLNVQDAIQVQGYTVSRVQRVDIGLNNMGYVTDKYRVVFYGKPEEIRALTDKYPEMIPYLPLKIAIFAEGEQTLVVAHHPLRFAQFFPHKELQDKFSKWERDLEEIMHAVRLFE